MPVPTAEQLNTYEVTPARIADAIADLSEAQIYFTPGEDEWSIQEVIIHLADSEVFAYERLHKALAEDQPTVEAFDENAWASNLNYHSQDRNLALVLFTALRNSTSALLRTLPPEAWQRTCLHPERGTMSIYDIFSSFLNHGDLHLRQIEQIKATI
jgi:uncharacterized damage-inducible protein DinB